jgi:hypothetical protein
MSDELSELIAETKSVSERVEQTFGALSAAQLNWKPGEDSWSVAQCLDHLMTTNRLEFPAIENALRAGYKNPFWSKIPFLSKVCGRIGIYLFKPQNPRKFKAPKSFQPSRSDFDEKIVANFLDHQQDLIGKMERCRNLNVRKTKIVSPVSDAITYSLADAFRILVVHEQRHFEQARRVTKTKGFPVLDFGF